MALIRGAEPRGRPDQRRLPVRRRAGHCRTARTTAGALEHRCVIALERQQQRRTGRLAVRDQLRGPVQQGRRRFRQAASDKATARSAAPLPSAGR